MKLSGLGLDFAHLDFFFLFVIGMLRFSIFVTHSRYVILSYLFIHSFTVCVCVCVYLYL